MTANNSHAQTTRANAHAPGKVADYVDFTAIAAPANPASTEARLYLDTADGMLKWRYSDGTVRSIGAGLTNPMTTAGDIIYGGSSGTPTRLAAGTNTHVLTLAAGVPSWAAPSGGGSAAHAYLGYNTVGGSTETMVTKKVYAKKVTVSAAGIIQMISAYVDSAGTTNDDVDMLGIAVYSDNAGTPDSLLMANILPSQTVLLDDTAGTSVGETARWFGLPCGLYVPATDYWIAVTIFDPGVGMRIYYDGSGTDRHYTSGGDWVADWGFYSPTTTTNRYSIRASILTF
jgi:hypothetical protein